MDKIKFSEEVYTPDLAKKILEEQNLYNRAVCESRVRFYAEQYRNKTFLQNGETIKFSICPKTGKEILLDGQHRLRAVISSKITMTFLTARNVDFNSFTTIDKGLKRSASNDLYIKAKLNGTSLSANCSITLSGGIGYLLSYEKHGVFLDKSSTLYGKVVFQSPKQTVEIQAFYDKNEAILLDILCFMRAVKNRKKAKIVPDSVFLACAYLQFKKNKDIAIAFWEQLYEKEMIAHDLRINALRDICVSSYQIHKAENKNIRSCRSFQILRAVVVCWNSIVDNRQYATTKGITSHYGDDLVIK